MPHNQPSLLDFSHRGVRINRQLLLESEARFEAAFHGSPDAMVINRTHDGLIVEVNRAYEAFFGYARDELIGRTAIELGLIAEPALRAVFVDQLLREGKVESMRWLSRTRNGEVKQVLQSGYLVAISGEQHHVAIIRDLTPAIKSAIALRESEARFSAVFHANVDAVAISRVDDGTILDVNGAYERLTGFSRKELVGSRADDLGIVCREVDGATAACGGALDRRDVEVAIRSRSGQVRSCLRTSYAIAGGDNGACVCVLRDVTESLGAQAALRQSEERLRQAVRVSDIGIFDHDHVTDTIFWSPEQRAIYGWNADEEVTLQKYLACVHPQDLEEIRAEVVNSHDPAGEGSFDVEHRILRRDGEVRWLTTRGRTFFAGTGPARRAVRTVGAAADITERRGAEQALRIAATAFESREGRIITDEHGAILQVNRAFRDLTGYCADEAVGKNPSLLRSSRHGIDFFRAMWLSITSYGHWQGEIWNRRRSGEEFPAWLSITAVRNAQGRITHYVANFCDISEQKAAEEQIRNLAFFDSLTRLPNRRFLIERLQRILDMSARSGRYCAAMFIDLDHFKNLNDTSGHAAGDSLLLEVAHRLQGAVRAEDIVARLGGDEFVVVLDDLAPDREVAAAKSEIVAEHLRRALRDPCNLPGRTVVNTASIGICIFRGDQDQLEDVLKRADTAMYQAKNSGRDTARFFDPGMQAALEERARIESQLRLALEREEFSLHYQVQVDESGRVLGAEALLRWMQPEDGAMSPARFIPVAEETGIILPIGRWVLESACAQLRRWRPDPAMRHVAIAVNVSARQFAEPGFVGQVRELVQEYGIEPGCLKIELTESLLIRNIDEAIEKMHALKSAGIVFSMDDFGTGHSSLNYLKRLPLDQLKIDQSFVRDIAVDPNDATIVRTVISMGKSLGMQVIAEGVENSTQLQLLKSYGCNAFQGYLFGKPLPAVGFELFVKQAAAPDVAALSARTDADGLST